MHSAAILNTLLYSIIHLTMGVAKMQLHSYFQILFLLLNIHVLLASNFLSSGQFLTGNQTVSSPGGIFELGFFKPGKSPNYYLGIWYKQLPVHTVVWVANRDSPLLNTSSTLKLSEDGNLVLLNQVKVPIWSTYISSSSSNSVVAVLLDTGNLVLRDGSNLSTITWQSFEHPTDTWLPHARIGMNKVTGEFQHLSPWKNSEDPSPGKYVLQVDPDGRRQYYLVWNRKQRYWFSGLWNGIIFANAPEMTERSSHKFDYVSNEKVGYFTYTVNDSSVLSRYVLDVSGTIKQFVWLTTSQEWILVWSRPRNPCDAYSVCGSFSSCNHRTLPICECLEGFEPKSPEDWKLNDWSGGCVANISLKCGDASYRDGFQTMRNVLLPTNSHSMKLKKAKECELACLSNCSCSAYSYKDGCYTWSGNFWNLKQLSVGDADGRDIYIRIVELPKPEDMKKRTFVIGVTSLILLALLGNLLVLIWRCRGRRSVEPFDSVQRSLALVPFRYIDLQNVTKNFSERLSAGSFGSVFKGALSDSTSIAVKMLERTRQADREFRAEVSVIGTFSHVNLVRLLGFCYDHTKRLLVYNHMPNGSLADNLFHSNASMIDWNTRYQIALGTARGLAYLHMKGGDSFVHGEIKPENILLDADFCPKIANFGLAKLFGQDFSRILTTIKVNKGYLAPEWRSGSAITSKVDVYSYGMVLLEIISGRRNPDQTEDGEFGYFPTCFSKRFDSDEEILCLLDYKLSSNFNENEVIRAFNIACWCIQDNQQNRPSMEHVVQVLERVVEVTMPPIPHYLQSVWNDFGKDRVFSESSPGGRSYTSSSATSSPI